MQAHSQGNVVSLVKPIFIIFWSFGQIFLFCNFAENVTSQFAELNDTFYQCDWYVFSPKVQRMLPTIMINAQQPVIVRGFGNILCTREVFKNVNSIEIDCQESKLLLNCFLMFGFDYFISGGQWRIFIFYGFQKNGVEQYNCYNVIRYKMIKFPIFKLNFESNLFNFN